VRWSHPRPESLLGESASRSATPTIRDRLLLSAPVLVAGRIPASDPLRPTAGELQGSGRPMPGPCVERNAGLATGASTSACASPGRPRAGICAAGSSSPAIRVRTALARRRATPNPPAEPSDRHGLADPVHLAGSTRSKGVSPTSPTICSGALITAASKRWRTTSAAGSPPGTRIPNRSCGSRPQKRSCSRSHDF
jgi:hypothetical protein